MKVPTKNEVKILERYLREASTPVDVKNDYIPLRSKSFYILQKRAENILRKYKVIK